VVELVVAEGSEEDLGAYRRVGGCYGHGVDCDGVEEVDLEWTGLGWTQSEVAGSMVYRFGYLECVC